MNFIIPKNIPFIIERNIYVDGDNQIKIGISNDGYESIRFLPEEKQYRFEECIKNENKLLCNFQNDNYIEFTKLNDNINFHSKHDKTEKLGIITDIFRNNKTILLNSSLCDKIIGFINKA